jgi:hypothetical protein
VSAVEAASGAASGIFYENAVNKILRDVVAAIHPEWCVVRGEFTPRGGLTTSVFARWPKIGTGSKRNKNSVFPHIMLKPSHDCARLFRFWFLRE